MKGIIFRLTILTALTPAISAQAISTPATGLTVLPMDADRFIGNKIDELGTPNLTAILGISGANAKNDALPLPMSIEAKNIIIVITIPMPTTPSPAD